MTAKPSSDLDQSKSIEAEQVVLGACLTSPALIADVAQVLKVEQFFEPRHGTIFSTMQDLDNARKPVEVASVITALRDAGLIDRVGGPEHVIHLYRQSSVTSAMYYAEMVREHHIRRTLSGLGERLTRETSSGSAITTEVALATLLTAVDDLRAIAETTGFVTGAQSMGSLIDDLDPMSTKPKMQLTSTGIPDLDRRLGGGMRPGQLVVNAAQSGVGKSMLVTQALVANSIQAEDPKPTLMITMEMSHEEVSERIASQIKLPGRTRLDYGNIRSGDLNSTDFETLCEVQDSIKSAPYEIEDAGEQTISSIRARVQKFVKRHGSISLLIVDYIQQLSAEKKGENRQAELTEFAKKLKAMAKEFNCTVMTPAQLNRDNQLRESEAIKQYADVLIYLERPEVADPYDRVGEADLIIKKQRGGVSGTETVAFQGGHCRFVGYAQDVA